MLQTTRTVSIEQAADILGLARSTAYVAAGAGEIPAIRVGRRWLVPVARLESMLGEREGALSTPDTQRDSQTPVADATDAAQVAA
jgi:excisionase family DNA binding protein